MRFSGFIKEALLWVYWAPFKALVQRVPAGLPFFLIRVSRGLFPIFLPGKTARLEKELGFLGDRLTRRERGEAAKSAISVLLHNEIEVLYFPVLSETNIDRFVTASGLEHLDAALSKGKGAMLLFAHFGANQMVMPAIGYKGYRMCQLSAPATVWEERLPEEKLTPMFRRSLRTRWAHELSLPVKHINVFGSIKEAFLCLKRNEILGIAVDGGGGGTRVCLDFLGSKAFFSIGAVDIAMRTGCAVLPTFMVRGDDGRTRMIIEPPLEIANGDNAEKRNTEAFVKRLEEYVYRYPCHYLNFMSLRRFSAAQGEPPFFVDDLAPAAQPGNRPGHLAGTG